MQPTFPKYVKFISDYNFIDLFSEKKDFDVIYPSAGTRKGTKYFLLFLQNYFLVVSSYKKTVRTQ